MNIRRWIKWIFLGVIALGLFYVIRYCWVSFPIATGYSAKILCSGVFVSGRSADDIKSRELSFSPLHLVRSEVHAADSSVTTSLFGFAPRKAVYRAGLGATLLSDLAEDDVRSQPFAVPPTPVLSDNLPWPMGNLVSDTLPGNIDIRRLTRAIDNSFVEVDSAHPLITRAVVVSYDGKLIAERYAPGITPATRLTGWSMTKSITGALIGLLVKAGRLRLDEPAPVDEWRDPSDPRHAITIRNLLQQSSGLQFEEDYSKSSDATKMLFQRGDMAAYAASHALEHKPGTVFKYTSGNSNILSRIIRKTVGEERYHAFPYDSLLFRIGMNSAVMEPDPSGTFVGSSYSYATARDWARFGLLYLNDGVFNGERILPEGWVQQTVLPAPAAPRGEYGFQFWLNAGRGGSNRLFQSLPADMYFADGYEGQNVFVIPSKKLVVVRLGLTRTGDYNAGELLAEIIECIR